MDTLIKVKSGFFLLIDKQETEYILNELRDWLLPMLMNGQVRAGDVGEEMMGMAADGMDVYKSNVK